MDKQEILKIIYEEMENNKCELLKEGTLEDVAYKLGVVNLGIRITDRIRNQNE